MFWPYLRCCGATCAQLPRPYGIYGSIRLEKTVEVFLGVLRSMYFQRCPLLDRFAEWGVPSMKQSIHCVKDWCCLLILKSTKCVLREMDKLSKLPTLSCPKGRENTAPKSGRCVIFDHHRMIFGIWAQATHGTSMVWRSSSV